jgi:hypothetical protein
MTPTVVLATELVANSPRAKKGMKGRARIGRRRAIRKRKEKGEKR